jgi:toxin ParE2
LKQSGTTTRSAFGWGTSFVIRRINDFPMAWHSLGGSIRRCQMQRFPYGLIYEPTSVEIIIIAVAHLHQEPRYWRMRLKSNI